MKKRTTMLLCVFMVMAMIMTLTACGGGKATLTGDWKLYSMESGGQKFSAKDAETVGFTFAVSLNEDKTAKIETLGLELTGTWEETNATTAVATVKMSDLPDEEGSEFTFVLDGNRLSVDADGVKILFEKK